MADDRFTLVVIQMRAFKFRPSSQIGFAFDIVFNQRLHCADWSQLNDPMEGMFAYSSRTDAEDPKKLIDQIIREKQRIKICSLSRTFDCQLLWAHYASGFDGVAIEVDLPDRSPQVKIVTYRGVFAGLSIEHVVNPADTAREILTSKYLEWKYEREVRILHHEEWFPLAKPVQRVIAGHRMQPSLFKALHMICQQQGIRFCKTGIGDEGIDADLVPSVENAQ